jgi:hypothetical protein
MMTATSDDSVLHYHVLEIDKLFAGVGASRPSMLAEFLECQV